MTLTKRWLYVSGPRYTVCLNVSDKGKIVSAPPIARWTIGRSSGFVTAYFRSRRFTVTLQG